jgi:hypothetical protein
MRWSDADPRRRDIRIQPGTGVDIEHHLFGNDLFVFRFDLPAPVRRRGQFGSQAGAAKSQPCRRGSLAPYSIVVALHREARVVPQLIAALNALDYPGIMAQLPQEI